ncbi:MAG: efflux transporter outer membrane subunit [Cyclobacteriaceae bacterium]
MNRFSLIAALILLSLVVVMESCKVGPNYQRPNPVFDTTAVYRFDALGQDTVINLRWWELFGDEELHDLINIALRENQDLRIAAARIEESRAFLGFTRADLYPNISISGQGTRNNFIQSINQQVDVRNTFFLAPALSWEIDFWGKLRRAKEAAMAEMLATEYGRRSLQISLISEVAALYFQLLDYNQRLEISIRTLDSRRQASAIIEDRFNQGYTARIDLDQARIQEHIAEAAVPLYERLVAQTENALSILIGRAPESVRTGLDLYDQPVPPDIPSGIPANLLNRRPDILQREQELIAQNARVGVAVGAMLPSVNLNGFIGTSGNEVSQLFSDGSMIWSLGGGIVSPLFNFGKNKQRVEIEKQRTVQATEFYYATVLQSIREVEDALISIQTFERELNARLSQRAAASSAKSLSLDRYEGGVTSYLEVLENDRSYFQAELAAAEAQRLYFTSYISLYKALGGGWISEEEEINAASPDE